MTHRSAAWLDRQFKLIEDAAVAGERCPQTHPHGPLQKDSIPALFRAKRIRSEVYMHNYRVVTILVGPYAGKSTAHPGPGLKPYLINGARMVHEPKRKEPWHPARDGYPEMKT